MVSKLVEWRKFRKKPIVVEAYQATEREEISTREGHLAAFPGDWIVKGIEGEIYPVSKSIFEKTFEPANGEDVTEEIDDFDKELLKIVNMSPDGVDQAAIFWDYEDLSDSFISNRLKGLARDGRIKRVSCHNRVRLYPVV
jgi:hypothetical protein